MKNLKVIEIKEKQPRERLEATIPQNVKSFMVNLAEEKGMSVSALITEVFTQIMNDVE